MKFIYILIGCLIILASCEESKKTENAEYNLAKVPSDWISSRVNEAEKRLQESDAGKIVWKAMEAHGGLGKWYENGPISFQFDYKPRGEGARRNTMQVVDTWSNRTSHKDASDNTAMYGWSGDNAWVTEKDSASFAYNIRFWSTTPIFFLAQPFNFDGEGVVLEKMDDKMLEGIPYDVVKVSFEKGTGDAPDDYYINYYDKKSHRLEVIRYIVSYPGYFQDGGHTPEKLMTLHDFTKVDGIVLPTAYKTYMTSSDEGKGDYVTDIDVLDISFMPLLEKSYFDTPDKTMLITKL